MSNQNHQQKTKSNKRAYDIILYGATSFVGQITTRYLSKFIQEQQLDIKFAIAGRNQQKLDAVNAALNPTVDTLIANSNDSQSLDELTKQTRVLISTVGPYLKYGEPVIRACANNGTDYVDLTGEAIFIKDMLDKYQHDAKASGARIVNACGFDSIPSDLGVYFTQSLGEKENGKPFDTINMRVKAAKGGLSGGTVASMVGIFEKAAKDKSIKKQLKDPYLLNDDNSVPTVRQNDTTKPVYDAMNDRWLAPFIMASINTRVVHRSNQLLDYRYGHAFRYDEAIWMPAGNKGKLMSHGMAVGLLGFAIAMSFDVSRNALTKHVLPKTGTGPDKQQRDNGFFDLRFFAYADGVPFMTTKVTGNQDPGYGSTSMMLAQSALCLLQDVDKDSVTGGFWTPAAAMGQALIDRLQTHAGMRFDKV